MRNQKHVASVIKSVLGNPSFELVGNELTVSGGLSKDDLTQLFARGIVARGLDAAGQGQSYILELLPSSRHNGVRKMGSRRGTNRFDKRQFSKSR